MSEQGLGTRVWHWLDRWVFTLWTPIVLALILSPLFWIARSGNNTAGVFVTAVIEVLGALLIISLIAKIWYDQKR